MRPESERSPRALSTPRTTNILAGDDEPAPPSMISVKGIVPADGARVTMLGVEGDLEWQHRETGFEVTIPSSVRDDPPCSDAWVLRISAIKGT